MTERAGIYCRLSLAVLGDTTKVDDQERICRDLATARGWDVPDEFVWKDNGRSAWQRNRKRKGWDAMLEAVSAGRVRNLIVYHGDRLVRQPYDLEVLINLADRRGVTITSPTGTRRLDVAEDRFVLGILANVARLESDNTSRRKRAGFARMAREGRAPVPGGRYGRGFGYEADGFTHHPVEAPALREAAARVLAGERLTVIAASLTQRGIMATSGLPFGHQSLKRVLMRLRTAGLLADGTAGNWEPILGRETWEMVGGILRARAAGYPGATNDGKYLLSGIARCGVCRSGLQRQSAGRSGRVVLGYGCVKPGCRKIHRDMAMLDAYVITRVMRRINSPAVARALAAAPSPVAAEIAELEKRRAETRSTAANLAANPNADLALLTAAIESFDRRIAELRARAQAGAGTRLLAAHQVMTPERWDALPLATRRALVTACFRVTVLPASRRGPGFRTEDVRLTPM